jgi:hypothetical protein
MKTLSFEDCELRKEQVASQKLHDEAANGIVKLGTDQQATPRARRCQQAASNQSWDCCLR